MTSRVSSKNKEKMPKGKIVFKTGQEKKRSKKKTNRKKKRYKETENIVAGSRTRFICTCKQLLDHFTTVTRNQ